MNNQSKLEKLFKIDLIVEDLVLAGFDGESIVAAIKFDEEFPYSFKESEREFHKFLDDNYDGLATEVDRLRDSVYLEKRMKKYLKGVSL